MKKRNAKKIRILLFISLLIALIAIGINASLSYRKMKAINSFYECENAGYTITDNYPLQCTTPDGRTFSESISKEDAWQIAVNSQCIEMGAISEEASHNENSLTWWFDMEMNPEFEKVGCNPACVVNEITKTAEINWRCTGLVPE